MPRVSRHGEFDLLPEVTLELVPDRWLVPDISVCPRAALDLRHDTVRLTEPPLLTVEIVSPSQGLEEILEKVEFYLARGVQSVWMITPPPLREVTIFLPDGTQQSYHTGKVCDPATGLTADLGTVFS